ncbi:hypothetical protein F511_46246 [Dorcoceras hygrometricum]|uniref:Uncharacterized protein n=1 Tax=Dorcoceras hygrometricum TaxID=472368 RepID=A0A2Z6ZUH1_9LAMI|nr:hypothetical protein F511_46246 [Dorcoceras hygrometricum]
MGAAARMSMRDHRASLPGAWHRLARRWSMLAVRLSHERQPHVAPLLGVLLRDVAPLVALDGRVSPPRDGATGRRFSPLAATHDEAGRATHARCCGRECAMRCARFFVTAPPPAGRRSGDAPASFRRCCDGWSEFF